MTALQNAARNEGEPPLMIFDRARAAVAEASAVDEVKAIRDQAQALHAYYKQRDGSIDMTNQLAEIKLRAERRIGELLASGKDRQHQGEYQKSNDPTFSPKPSLAELGISKSQSSDWQAVASIPEPVFEEHVADTKGAGVALTTAGLLRKADPRPHKSGPVKTRKAIEERRQKMREMARDGYRPSAIAQVVGMDEQTVRSFLSAEGIESVEHRIGKTARIDITRAMEALIEGAAPSDLAVAAINADWDQLDRARFPEWIASLNSAMNIYRRLRDRMQRIEEGKR